MSLLTPRRVDTPELLDEDDAPPAEMLRSLRDLRRINRFLGGRSIYRRMIRRMGGGTPRLTILDLGTGTSDLLSDLARRREIRGIGLDFKIQHLHYGRDLDPCPLSRVQADAFHLPFRNDSVDIVTSAHFFHHFNDQANGEMLREALRVARIGVAVNDTRRHAVPLFMVRLLSALQLVGEITRFDAPASVLRGYTTQEAETIARATAASRSMAINLFPFRFGLLLWK